MKRTHGVRGSAIAALVLVGTAATAQTTFYGAQIAGGWPVAQTAANSDWSSDLGADYRYGASANGSVVEWTGQGSHSSSRPSYSTFESDFSLRWEGTARGGIVGQTHSGGELRIGPQVALTGGGVSWQTVHLWSILGTNDAGYGISTDARHHGYAAVLLGPQPQQLHWRLDWSSRVQGDAITSANLYFAGVFNQAIGGGSGSASGFWSSAGAASAQWVYPDFQFSSLAGDNAGDPRSGRIDTWVTLRLSTEPILTPVPEPASWALMLGGLGLGLCGALGAVRRRVLNR